MSKIYSVAYAVAATAILMIGVVPAIVSATSPTTVVVPTISAMRTLPAIVETLKAPDIQSPAWLKAQDAAEAARKVAPLGRTVTYTVMTRGTLTADIAQFRAQANETLNDNRGWARLGVAFREVASGGSFTLVLSEASQVPTFSPTGCSADYSCRVGQYVIINQDRWLAASPAWNAAGGSVRDYRHMVINHETGHWLGHGHESCGRAGQAAPVMQQQSIDLQGCGFNAWPLASELWSTQLGIKQ